MQCSYEGCDKKIQHRSGKYANLCIGHVAQMKSKGAMLPLRKTPVKGPQPSVEERFLKMVDKTDTCWLWTAGCVTSGYGSFSIDGKTHRAHRVAYELWVEKLDRHSVVHHTCAVRTCVNPAHLQAVTQQENVAEMLERNGYLARIEELEEEVAALQTKKKGWWRRGK